MSKAETIEGRWPTQYASVYGPGPEQVFTYVVIGNGKTLAGGAVATLEDGTKTVEYVIEPLKEPVEPGKPPKPEDLNPDTSLLGVHLRFETVASMDTVIGQLQALREDLNREQGNQNG